MERKVLLIGCGHTPTGRLRQLYDHLFLAGITAEYRTIGGEIQGKKIHDALVDDHLMDLDFSELELRAHNVLVQNNVYPDMIEVLKEPAPDQRKGPKGPRGKWGKLK